MFDFFKDGFDVDVKIIFMFLFCGGLVVVLFICILIVNYE